MRRYSNDAPIPGQSLTLEPGNAAWERPPKYASVDDAFQAYLDKFDDPESKDALFQLVETGLPLTTLVTTLTREAVRAGVHTVDASVVLQPAIHEYIRNLADSAGISYVEDARDVTKDKKKLVQERAAVSSYLERESS